MNSVHEQVTSMVCVGYGSLQSVSLKMFLDSWWDILPCQQEGGNIHDSSLNLRCSTRILKQNFMRFFILVCVTISHPELTNMSYHQRELVLH